MILTFLGTSAGTITTERNVSASLLQLTARSNRLWLFDCGEGTQHQMLKAKISLSKLEKIFITHLHGDHIFGLPGLLASRSLNQHAMPLTIYGPKGIRQFIEMTLNISCSMMTYPLQIVEIEQATTLYKDEQVTIYCDELAHRVQCFGYRIEEAERTPKLDIVKLQTENIPVGSLYGELKKGKIITMPDGKILDGKNYWLGKKPGFKIAILGDTTPCDASIRLASEVDLLVHEATFKHELQEKAQLVGHSTTVDAANIAKICQVKRLIIMHISTRYGLSDNESLLAECRQIFPHTDIAYDLFQVNLA